MRTLRQAPGDLHAMMALLKELWKRRRPGHPEAPGARLVRRWCEKRLLARIKRDWPGGLALHRAGDLVHVPSPLDARGRHALRHPPHVRPAVLGFVQTGSIVIEVGANLGEWTVPFARKVGPAGQVLALDPPFYVGHAHNLLLVPDRVISRVAEEMPVPPRGRGPLRH